MKSDPGTKCNKCELRHVHVDHVDPFRPFFVLLLAFCLSFLPSFFFFFPIMIFLVVFALDLHCYMCFVFDPCLFLGRIGWFGAQYVLLLAHAGFCDCVRTS